MGRCVFCWLTPNPPPFPFKYEVRNSIPREQTQLRRTLRKPGESKVASSGVWGILFLRGVLVLMLALRRCSFRGWLLVAVRGLANSMKSRPGNWNRQAVLKNRHLHVFSRENEERAKMRPKSGTPGGPGRRPGKSAARRFPAFTFCNDSPLLVSGL